MLESVRASVEPVLGHYGVPGVVLAATRSLDEPGFLCLGLDAAGKKLEPRSLFPVASITKLATALAVLRLVDSGRLELDAPLNRYLPQAASAQPGVTLRRLLCHTSGLPEDVPPELAPYAPGLTWSLVARACLETPLRTPPFSRVRYSNVGFGLLAIIVEQFLDMIFGDALETLVLHPLEIEGYLGKTPPRAPAHLADVRGSNGGTELEPYNSAFWQSLAFPWGGLVTDAGGALNLVRAFHGFPASFLSLPLLREAVSNQTGDLPGGYGGPFMYERCPWGLGPDLRDHKQPHWAPAESSPGTFGHAGASGCVAWCDPQTGVNWAILGTRTADNGWLLRGSPAISSAILQALG